MKIRLAEIPADGRSFKFDRASGEFNSTMNDFVQAHPYEIEFTIRPIGNAFELRGQLKTTMSDVCSLCGWDIEIPIQKRLSEILIEDLEMDRTGRTVGGNSSVDFDPNRPNVFNYQGDSFDADAYVFEAVGASEPLYPSCGVDDCEHLEEAREIQARLKAEFESANVEKEIHPGLAALKNLDFGFEQKN